MDRTTSPGWANGYKPVTINPLPASFVAFFPAAHEAKTESFEISWADKFVAQKPATFPRAWCRVPVAAGRSTLHRGRRIMKRVGRWANSPAVRPQKVADAEVAVEDLEETQQKSRRRLNSFVPPAQEAQLELAGSPLSRAEVVNTLIRAKVNVANCFLHEEYTEISDQRSLAKQSTFSKMVVPMKRRFHDYSSIGFEYASGGNRMAIYSELDPIISKALQTGVTEIDVNMASITEAAAHLQSTRRNPRILLAASGTPDLADIVDVIEPSSPLTLEPNESMTDAKSPTKRDSTQSPSPTKSNKSFRKRLSDTIVKLLPVSSTSRAEPSPIKPAGPPTPNKDVGERRPSITLKSPNAAKSPLSVNSTPGLIRWSSRTSKDSPFARWRPKRKSEPAARRLSQSLSLPRNQASPITDTVMEQSSVTPESPVRQARPLEPTPSKWNGSQPLTPGRKPSSTVATPNGDELELVKSLPEWMQHTQSPATLEKCDLSNIDFGPASPSFTNSVSWVNSPENAMESERTKIVRRRKSEPLFRNLLKTQTSRRISLSPRKPIRPDGTSGVMPAIDENTSHIEDGSQISKLINASDNSNILATPAIIPIDTAEQDDENMDILSAQYKQKMQAAMEAVGSKINPDDVFSPETEKTAVQRLAKMAETSCNGYANVVTAKENGRFFVRFKLPFEYASMFPESQCADESHFSSSPSVSSSPRVQPPAEPPLTEEEMWELEEELYLEESDRRDQTLVASDFGSSPAKRSASSPPYDRLPTSSPAPLSQDINDVSISFPDITYAPEGNTTIPGLANSSPLKTPKMSKSMINSDSSSLSDLEHTPSLNKSAELSITNMAAAAADDEEQQEAAPTTPAVDDTTPTLSLSFTPVNQASARKSSTSSSTRSTKAVPKASPDNEAAKSHAIPATSHTDTPERDYMRDFIRRSRPRRPSTTELGSPIAPTQRRPLGARSPNMETQQKEKRKFDSSEGEENKSETKAEPATKRIRRLPRATPPKPASAVASDHSDDEDPLAMDANTAVTSADELANSEDQENVSPAAAADVATSRRSSRLRTMPSTVPKSSIPAPIKVGRGRPANSTLGHLRTEQHDLVHQTRANTRRNKGKAEYPAQVIAKRSEQEEEEEVDQEMSDPAEEVEVSKTRLGKSVVWKDPLADYHEEDYPEEAKPKRGRPTAAASKAKAANAAKAKAKPVSTGRITKPAPKASAPGQKQRSTRLAAGLGMAGNGTPAPKRVTRASARSRK
ncbi:hypothetical protein ACHAQJ_010542 [Trichoderma viride]